ncbi:MAG: ABC transporter ATP-binding protein [Firmicutes bacterium]|nr:ABC transporter ATP-binding protein [Dethiobacter sp.]MBS3888887.1 ABC transporter ATP-binding protein [Bacillota bacterium]
MRKEPSIICDMVGKVFAKSQGVEVRALHNVSLQTDDGEVVGLIGPNGSGKTTLFRAMAGFLWPSSGSIRLKGMDPQKALENRIVGFLAEEPRFSQVMKVKDYWRAYLSLARPSRPEHSFVADAMEIASFSDKKIGQLSRGMLQRFALSMCLVFPRQVYLLDEPTESLDVNFRWNLIEILSMLRKQGATIVYASHNLNEVANICDRVLVMRKGQLHQQVATVNTSMAKFRAPEGLKLPEEFAGIQVSANGTEYVVEVPNEQVNSVCRYVLDQSGDIIEIRPRSLEDLLKTSILEDIS